MTWNNVIQAFNDIADSHKQINSFGYGELADIASSGTIHYPLMYVAPKTANIRVNVLRLNFTFVFADLVKRGFEQEVESDQLQIATDVLSLLQDAAYAFKLVNSSLNLERFRDRFDDDVTGWTLDVSLDIESVKDICAVPYDGVFNPLSVYSNEATPYPFTWGNITGTLSRQLDLQAALNALSGGGTTDLSIANKTATTLDVLSSTGTDIIVPQATITEAGLLIATDKVKLNNTTNTNSGNETAATIGAIVNGATDYPTPLNADKIGIWDVANALFKAVTWVNIKATLKTYFDTLYVTPYNKIYAYQNTDSSVTGTTSQTVLANLKVTGGDMGANGKLDILSTWLKAGTASTSTVRFFHSTDSTNIVGNTGTPTSSVQLALVSMGATNAYSGIFRRQLINKNNQNVNSMAPTTVAALSDATVSTTTRTDTNINTTNDFWIVVTAVLGNTGDTITLADVNLIISKP